MSTGRKVAVITGASQGIRAALVKVGSFGEQLDATSLGRSFAQIHYFAVQVAAQHILSGSIRCRYRHLDRVGKRRACYAALAGGFGSPRRRCSGAQPGFPPVMTGALAAGREIRGGASSAAADAASSRRAAAATRAWR